MERLDVRRRVPLEQFLGISISACFSQAGQNPAVHLPLDIGESQFDPVKVNDFSGHASLPEPTIKTASNIAGLSHAAIMLCLGMQNYLLIARLRRYGAILLNDNVRAVYERSARARTLRPAQRA